MQGSQKVIEQLKGLLACELAARDQYFIHSRMYEDWGLSKLFERISHESEEETEHADILIKRILFLGGVPDVNIQDKVNVGDDVPAMLKNDLQIEYDVGQALKDAMKVCEEESDYVSRDLLFKLLDDTEMDHTWWLEKQLGLIDKIGLQNYLQSQL
ncbi:MAG: bacterioferritin [Proteobacteria bacterium]|nr:MAG: bacterioferritin [Pseudomonadota bacterium]